MSKKLQKRLADQIAILESIVSDEELMRKTDSAICLLSESLAHGIPLLVFGNGGSAADALHITAELVGTFNHKRKPLNVICLNSNSALITAWSNDYEYETIFSRQIEAFSSSRAVCLGLSTSGDSANVLHAFSTAKRFGHKTIAFTGKTGGKVGRLVDHLINVPSTDTPRIQEAHQCIYHYMCECIESNIDNRSFT